jgi:DNA-directed RNA polymerase specialized sigma24 family protein
VGEWQQGSSRRVNAGGVRPASSSGFSLRHDERPDHTLRATALVNEAYLRLLGSDVAWQDRVHFFAVSARLLRRILVDYARNHGRQKRSGGAEKVTLGFA